jgi:hypothetical protein
MEESMSSDARTSVLVHASEELLEEYSFGRICEPQLGWLEEHLLVCLECQSALDDIEEYKVFMKAGLASFERERRATLETPSSAAELDLTTPPPLGLRKTLPLNFTFSRMPLTRNLAAAGLLLGLAGTTVWRMNAPMAPATIASVRLTALRGGEGSIASVPSGHRADLEFDRTDLPPDLSYRAEVVNASGRRVWSGSVRSAGPDLSIRLNQPLPAGTYWVRLNSSDGQLLREFGLNVE